MKQPWTLASAVILLAAAVFCVYGFFAAFEPSANPEAFRICYAVVGVGCLAASVALFVRRSRR
jgi:hypothetical protein